MANINKPFGFRPVRGPNGAAWSGEANIYVILSGDTSDYYIGDLVMPGGEGDAFGIPSAIKYAAAGSGATAPLGAIVGVLPVPPRNASLVGTPLSLESKTLLGTVTVNRYILVTDSPDIVYEVQTDSVGLPLNSIGSNVDVTVATPAQDQQVSATVLLNTSDAATATLPFRIIGFVQAPDNEITATVSTATPFVRALVRPNEHAWKVGTLGLGV